ncbi:MAG TPA: hypothetical protein V6D03_09420 [Candidatus Caenarcaniphilales bacterium]
MAKKRLVDLLREEAEKASEAEIETVQRRDTVPNTSDVEVETDQEVASAQELETDTSTPLPVLTSSAHARRTGPTKAELEVTVTELKEAVQEAQRKETYLQKRTDDLQSALNEQKTLVEKLQAELGEAKKVILQLSEVKDKTTQEKVPKSRALALEKSPHHTTQPNSSPEMFSNRGIGWAD